ncbi:predicted protein [Verticillium alfalfae VaMs.102]|uniref:Predicted protein n=1 Tax=Verticillium alfalfae (strain VaMs.102 / ATCC MYA-4576 / FGSC 10136) TaxID=526221 RepID=C9S7J9_VERA1|nr:predicted protein [Verticillium alfalfae VaMs.102]EEY14760.1 predicted protein [Verticillium alfalfae VaMs.102]
MAVMAQPAGPLWRQGFAPVQSDDGAGVASGAGSSDHSCQPKVPSLQDTDSELQELPQRQGRAGTRAPLHPRSLPLGLNPSDATSAIMMSHLSLNLARTLYASDGEGDWDRSTMCLGRSLDSGQSLYRDAHINTGVKGSATPIHSLLLERRTIGCLALVFLAASPVRRFFGADQCVAF